MCQIYTRLSLRLRAVARDSDRGEFGPMAYVVMVSAMVLLAVAVVAWGERIADAFMANVDEGW